MHYTITILIWQWLQIMKEDVDRYGKNKRIPSCQLIAKCYKQESTLEHVVWLKGAKKPFNYFRLHKSSSKCRIILYGKTRVGTDDCGWGRVPYSHKNMPTLYALYFEE